MTDKHSAFTIHNLILKYVQYSRKYKHNFTKTIRAST